MADKPTGSNGVLIAVAVIGALGAVGAALVNMNKPKETIPTIEQNSSGAGAINAGRDAIVTNNIKSPSEEAAERVQGCEERHGMKQALEKSTSSETIPATAIEEAQFVEHIEFRSCTWPVSSFADGDGYLQISVRTVSGPGDSEASGTDEADRFKAPCRRLRVTYDFGHMGDFEAGKPFFVDADTVVVNGEGLWKNDGHLPFYPDHGEFVVLHNGHYDLQTAECVQ